ncbi:MAG: hypothetical protein K2N05_12670 [Muribaculaceae bacterium]|nr:hypothetical protein [Muribaculaceae bacterium]
MNKPLLTLALAALTATGAFSIGPTRVQPADMDFIKNPNAANHSTKTATRAEVSEVDFGYADDPASALYLKDSKKGDEYYLAIEMPKETAASFAGDEITGVNITTGVYQMLTGAYTNRVVNVELFITEDLESEPIYTQAATLGKEAFTEYRVPLDTPVKIEEGKSYFVGYSFVNPITNMYYLAVDGLLKCPEACWVGKKVNGKVEWNNYYDQMGALCLSFTVKGENLPQNGVQLVEAGGSLYCEPGKPFEYGFMLKGAGQNADQIEITATIGNGAPQVKTISLETSLGYNQYGIVYVDGFVCDQEGLSIPMTFEITKVNGVDNTSSSNTYSSTIDCYDSTKGFPRVHLVEEATGTWCGWCPRGIVLLEYIREKYPDMFACAAIHQGDPMQVSSTTTFLNSYVGGYPFACIDRTETLQSMSDKEIDSFVEAFKAVPTTMAITDVLPSIGEDGKLTVDAKVQSGFDLDNNNRYRVGYYLTEDGMGPYNQSNNYAGGRYGEMGGWESKSSSVSTIYNEVVRLCVGGVQGLDNSLPDKMEAGVTYYSNAQMSLSAVTSDKFYITAWIFDNVNGAIVNCKQIEVSKSGVNDVATDSNTVARRYYNLNGVEVSDPSNGIYIMRSVKADGSVKTEKVIVK